MDSQQQLFDSAIAKEKPEAQANLERIREEYRARLAEKLKDPEFRKIEGFPIGTDEAILALSDPPYYTACPNPFIAEWLVENGNPYDAASDTYHREPFAADVSEGKNDPIYNAHSYHTKVPHKAIMRYILHYTEPGDVVYDGFCGTGMTGVAAQMCGNKAQVESLGYRVQDDSTLQDEAGKPLSMLGARKAILNDLSPAATFIAYNYIAPADVKSFGYAAKQILAEVEAECGWMYLTLHDANEVETERVADAVRACQTADDLRALFAELKDAKSPLRDADSKLQIGIINYTVWSDVMLCSNCGTEMVYWDVAVDKKVGKVKEVFKCECCRAENTKRKTQRALISVFDASLGIAIQKPKQKPVSVTYMIGKKRHQKPADSVDLILIDLIEQLPASHWYPSEPMMGKGEGWGDTYRSGYCFGTSHTHHFFTRRNLLSASAFVSQVRDKRMLALLTGIMADISRQARVKINYYFNGGGGAFDPGLSGVIYFPSISVEKRPLFAFENRLETFTRAILKAGERNCLQACQSVSNLLTVPDVSVDYVFTDPPFGENLQYSELNFVWESWLRVKTNNKDEAVVNNSQRKNLVDYQSLMSKAFCEYFRILKPGRWMTVEFHNSANAVWNVIQESLERAGFVVADVRVLDKKQQGFNAQVASSAVNQDLVISCYKPRTEFEIRFRDLQGTPESATEFVRQHLFMLPVTPLSKDGKIELVAERNRFLLFDRMIAYHLQKGAPIPLDAASFYKMLEEQFTCRDEMYFLPEQAARFDALKTRGVETEQLSIFVQDEKTAVQWVRGALAETPQTLGELTPTFMQELRDWPAHEPRPELKDLLREYFIHSDDGVWRVPNPDDEKDIEQLRKNALLRLFRDYTKAKGPLKVFRKEAIIQGFTTCYETSQYGVIVSVCEKIPEKIRDEIQEFVMFYDIAKSLAPPEIVQTEFVFE